MDQSENQFNQQLCAFLDASPTPFHAVSSMVGLLSEAGFTELSDDQSWSLKQGGKILCGAQWLIHSRLCCRL